MKWPSLAQPACRAAALLAFAGFGIAAGSQNPPSPAATAPATAAPATAAPAAKALLASIQGLETTLDAIPARTLRVNSQGRREYRAEVAAIERNVSAALPGLTLAVTASPLDVGKAFRLYRDADAVDQVAMHAAATVDRYGGREASDVLNANLAGVGHQLDALGNFIEVTGSAQSAALARAAAPPPAPRHLDISNANGRTPRRDQARRRTTKRPKHPSQTSSGGDDSHPR
ncbi:MAG: hypothetical protein ACRD2E_14490 [Terriglobales bacterium]